MRRILVLLLISAAAAIVMLQARSVYIYRNDCNFNALHIPDTALLINHRYLAPDTALELADDTIPLRAVDSIVVRQVDVPVLRFTFPDHPDYDWVVDKETYIPATLDIEGNGSVESQTGLELNVKGRGNSSWAFPKKPMRLKFSSKTSICGFTKAKSYVLLADFIDQTLMRNACALKLAQLMGIPYSNHFMPCHVYVNDNYAGAYLLTEKIGINKASVDIDDETGVLIELSTEYDEPYKFRSKYCRLPVMIKDPDFDELAEDVPNGPKAYERLAIWEEDFNYAEQQAIRKNAAEVFDIESFVNYLIVYDITLNNELYHPKSCYIYKEAPNEEFKYKFGPVWDFDASFNCILLLNGKRYYYPPQSRFNIHSMLSYITTCEEFVPIFKDRYDYFEQIVLPEFLSWFESYVSFIEPLARINGQRWPDAYSNDWICRDESTFDNRKHTAELRQWIIERAAYLRTLVDNNRFH